MPSRKPYAREFKIEAVKLVTFRDQPRKQVARDLGVDLTTLRRWIAEFEAAGERAFPGQGHARDEELARLRRAGGSSAPAGRDRAAEGRGRDPSNGSCLRLAPSWRLAGRSAGR
ncbi:MAG: transposase [Chloroflexota bacterium]|nr:transposase [Chloroflexota bacterium]